MSGQPPFANSVFQCWVIYSAIEIAWASLHRPVMLAQKLTSNLFRNIAVNKLARVFLVVIVQQRPTGVVAQKHNIADDLKWALQDFTGVAAVRCPNRDAGYFHQTTPMFGYLISRWNESRVFSVTP